jgi:Tfp pilus assembly protein PilV
MSKQKQMKRQCVGSAGFSLIETMFAIIVLAVGVLCVGAVLSAGIAYMNSSEQSLIPQQKATQTIESIFTPRDSGTL